MIEKFLSSKQPNIKFALEKYEGRLSFSKFNIFRQKFVTNVNRKRPSEVLILISTALYMKPRKLV